MINVKRLASFILLLYGSVTMAEQLTLAWDANTEPELSGYRLYQGSSSGNYSSSIDVGDVTTYTLTGLREGQTYYRRFAHFFGSFEDSVPYVVHEICNSINHAYYKSITYIK